MRFLLIPALPQGVSPLKFPAPLSASLHAVTMRPYPHLSLKFDFLRKFAYNMDVWFADYI